MVAGHVYVTNTYQTPNAKKTTQGVRHGGISSHVKRERAQTTD